MEQENRVSYYRKRRGMKQATLARSALTTQGEVSEIERGKTEPGVHLALRLARALGTTVEELFGERSTNARGQ